MSELRKDPFSNRWVVISKDRAERPDEFQSTGTQRIAAKCPFCAGNEIETPPAVLTLPAKSKGVVSDEPWQVRVVPNRFPAVHAQQPRQINLADIGAKSPLFEGLGGFGIHEVIIESPQHLVSYSQLSDQQATLVWQAYRQRIQAIRADGQMRHVQIFKNVGAAGGASVEHSHSQLIALPIVPDDVTNVLSVTQAWSQRNAQACPFCHYLMDEIKARARYVAETERFVAICPYAGRFPYETWVLPRQHSSHFETLDDAALTELASFIKEVVRRIERVTGRSDYNFLLQSAPIDSANLSNFHWHVAVFPRITVAAGFEWSTGIFINPVPPEFAAQRLQSAVC